MDDKKHSAMCLICGLGGARLISRRVGGLRGSSRAGGRIENRKIENVKGGPGARASESIPVKKKIRSDFMSWVQNQSPRMDPSRCPGRCSSSKKRW